MSREEAIKELKESHDIMRSYDVDESESRLMIALNMAIQALQAQADEDAISRQAVLDYIDKMPSELTADGRRMIRRRTLEEYISDTLSSVKPQEPTTKNDLGVDWDELKSKIFAEVDGGTDDSWLRYADVCDRISNSIDEYIADLPSVTPQEPKTGHWKRISMDKYTEHAKYWYRCDKCGKDNLGNTDWCPNCGERMESEQNE